MSIPVDISYLLFVLLNFKLSIFWYKELALFLSSIATLSVSVSSLGQTSSKSRKVLSPAPGTRKGAFD